MNKAKYTMLAAFCSICRQNRACEKTVIPYPCAEWFEFVDLIDLHDELVDFEEEEKWRQINERSEMD